MRWVLATILTIVLIMIVLIMTGMMLSYFVNTEEENSDSLEEINKELQRLNKAHDELFGIRRDKNGKIK